MLDCPINWKLAIDTFAENYHFATVHKNTFATIARSNCTVFDSFGPHHRLVFPLNGILDLENVPEEQWEPLQNMVVIYALFPNIVLSATIANGELFRVYPADVPGRSITVHQNSTPLDLSDESMAAGAAAVFDYAHATVRDEDYALVAGLQANLESGAREHLVFGRNEPGLQHRHQTVGGGTGPPKLKLCARFRRRSFEHKLTFAGACRGQHVVQLPVPIQRKRPLIEREAAHRLSASVP